MASFSDGQFVGADDLDPVTSDPGDLKWSMRRTPPSGWLLCDGSAISRTTYAALFAVLAPSLGTFTVTIASPGVFTLTAHGLVLGDQVYLTTTGALPTGLSANTIYYVVSTPTANTFTLSATRGGSAINTSGSQSGTHSIHWCPCGLGDGSTTFNVPDLVGRTLVAASGASGHSDIQALGASDGVSLAHRRPKHRHTTDHSNVVFRSGGSDVVPTTAGTQDSGPLKVGADPVNDPLDAPAYFTTNLFIKT
jgi:microcystin-dependent protein